MPEMDQGVKWLVQHRPQDVLSLPIPKVDYLGPLPAEIAAPQLIMDTLLRVRYKGIECAMDIEAEARPEPDIGSRLCDYAARVRGATGLRVISVVLWLQPHGKPPESPYKMYVEDLLLGTWAFWGIEVYELEADALLTRGLLGLLPLIPFTHNGDNEVAIERAAFDIYEQAPAEQKADLEALLGTFGSRAIGNAAMKAILGRLPMSIDLVKTSPLYQEWTDEALQEGLRIGREEGREEGQREALRQSILSILRQRFAAIPPEVDVALAQADLATVQAVLDHAVSDSLEQIRERLGLPPH